MRLTFTIRLNSPLLGDEPGPDRVMKFKREKGALVTDLPMWNWAWHTSLGEIGPDVYRRAVRMDRLISPPSITLYERRWTQGQQRMTRMHEAIRTNTLLTLGGSVVSPDPTESKEVQALRPPTEQELREALLRIGFTLGISPFGSSQGYGRFDIENMEIEGRHCQPPVGRERADGGACPGGGTTPAQDGDEETGVGRESPVDSQDPAGDEQAVLN